MFADLLVDLEALPEHDRFYSVIKGVLASNIFDWGAQVADARTPRAACRMPHAPSCARRHGCVRRGETRARARVAAGASGRSPRARAAQATVELYQSGTILEIYRRTVDKLVRPWRVDDFDALRARFFGAAARPHRRAVIFVDNAGADFVLGILPLARFLLQVRAPSRALRRRGRAEGRGPEVPNAGAVL